MLRKLDFTKGKDCVSYDIVWSTGRYSYSFSDNSGIEDILVREDRYLQTHLSDMESLCFIASINPINYNALDNLSNMPVILLKTTQVIYALHVWHVQRIFHNNNKSISEKIKAEAAKGWIKLIANNSEKSDFPDMLMLLISTLRDMYLSITSSDEDVNEEKNKKTDFIINSDMLEKISAINAYWEDQMPLNFAEECGEAIIAISKAERLSLENQCDITRLGAHCLILPENSDAVLKELEVFKLK